MIFAFERVIYAFISFRTGELVAIKQINLQPGDNFDVIQQEIVVLSQCHHVNIIAYHGSYLRQNRLWIITEYCGGGSLQDNFIQCVCHLHSSKSDFVFAVTGPLPELQIAYVIRETLAGLSYLHQMGKIHRDIKSANILLTSDGDVKLGALRVVLSHTMTSHIHSGLRRRSTNLRNDC